MSPPQSVALSCVEIDSCLGCEQSKALVHAMGKNIIAWQLEKFKSLYSWVLSVDFQ